MAKKIGDGSKKNEIAQVDQNTALEIAPDFIPAGNQGTEHIGREDVQLPRIALAQKMHEEVDEDNAKYIDGLKPGMFFNTVTKQIYGPGPLKFMIIRSDEPRFVEFIPRDEGGGVKDFNVPANDPRTKWHGDHKPVATKFYDYVIMLLLDDPSGENVETEVVGMSLKSSGIKKAKHLNTLFKMRRAKRADGTKVPVPIWAGCYMLESVDDKSPKGPFKNWGFDNFGWPDQETVLIMQHLHEEWKTKEVVMERDATPDDEGNDDM